ncbi:MAG: DUF5011 domain-containing protein [Bacteroidetes bacterium]|nr:DUF5011 domain-containing protein [Bacteroidota bacterium]
MKNIFFYSLIFVLSTTGFSCKKDEKKDSTPPVIKIKGENPYLAGKGTVYVDPGASALDETDGDISSKIIVTNNVNTADTGFYYVKYNVSDIAGNAAVEVQRTVKVIIF